MSKQNKAKLYTLFIKKKGGGVVTTRINMKRK